MAWSVRIGTERKQRDSKMLPTSSQVMSTSSTSLDLHSRIALYDAVATAACLVGVVAGIVDAGGGPVEGPGVDVCSRLRVDPRKLILKLVPIFLCPCPAVEACR
jgi:hypothetical protein